jgi:hypothetical protein
MSKTKGNWVIKTSVGGYWCGNAHFDSQIRKAQIYHWKEAAEEMIEQLYRRKYITDSSITMSVIPVVEPRELQDQERDIVAAYNSGFGAGYAEARDRIFKEIEKVLKSSKTTHVGQQFYGMILEDYLAEIKKTFGGN